MILIARSNEVLACTPITGMQVPMAILATWGCRDAAGGSVGRDLRGPKEMASRGRAVDRSDVIILHY